MAQTCPCVRGSNRVHCWLQPGDFSLPLAYSTEPFPGATISENTEDFCQHTLNNDLFHHSRRYCTSINSCFQGYHLQPTLRFSALVTPKRAPASRSSWSTILSVAVSKLSKGCLRTVPRRYAHRWDRRTREELCWSYAGDVNQLVVHPRLTRRPPNVMSDCSTVNACILQHAD